jgi:PAS domain S-box-containing protein
MQADLFGLAQLPGEASVSDSLEDSTPTTAEGALSRLKEVETQLSRMTKVFMDGADPIIIRDLDGLVLDINWETERVFGWNRDEVHGTRANVQLAPEYREWADEILHRVQRGETVRNVETAILTKSGGVIPVLVTVFLLTDESGQAIGFAEIVKDITQLKRAHAKLEQKNRELTQFANALTHDLRAPLNTIRGFADLVRSDCHGALEQQCHEHLQLIMEGADRMDRLISDVLDYALIENRTLSFQPVDCHDVLEQALSNLHAAIAENDAQITHDPLPTIQADKTQMVQLFQNLIGNALKFQGVGSPHIHVSCRHGEEDWEFSVRDNGIGMDADHVHKIFDAFQRLHADSVFPGTGIGLSICRGVVERHGGRVWVESEEGKGSVFRFTISRYPAGQPAAACSSATRQ